MTARQLANRLNAKVCFRGDPHLDELPYPLWNKTKVNIGFSQPALVLKSKYGYSIASFEVSESEWNRARFTEGDGVRMDERWMARFSCDCVTFHFVLTNLTPIPLFFHLWKAEGMQTLNMQKYIPPFESVKLDTDSSTEKTLMFRSVIGQDGMLESDRTGNGVATHFCLQVANGRDSMQQTTQAVEAAFRSGFQSTETLTAWECDTKTTMVDIDLPPRTNTKQSWCHSIRQLISREMSADEHNIDVIQCTWSAVCSFGLGLLYPKCQKDKIQSMNISKNDFFTSV